MKRSKIYLFIGALIVFSLCSSARSWAVVDAIIAVVNDELITLKDFKDYLRNTYVSLSAEGMPERQIQAIMLELEKNGINNLIEDKLILSRANQMGLLVSDKAIEGRMLQIKEKYPTEEAFLQRLLENGATVTDLRNKVEEQLKIKYVVEHEVKSKIYVNPHEVTEYYERNKDQFKRKERVNLDSIYIAIDGDRAKAHEKALQAMQLIQSGKDFIEVAKVFSDSPSIGVVEKGQLMPEIERFIFKLTDNELSEVLELDAGYYIFKMKGRIASQVADLKEVKKIIYDHLFQIKFKDSLTDWISQLKSEAYIDIKEE